MEESSNNKLNIDDKEEDEEEIANTYCPYKKVTNFFGGLFNNPQNKAQNSTKLTTEDTEKPKCPFGFTSKKSEGEKPKCPFGFTSSKKEPEAEKPKCPFGFTSSKKEPEQEKPKCPFGFSSNAPKGKCPFGFDSQSNGNKIKREDAKNASDDDSGEDEQFGGCPVMGKGKRDPSNKDFELFYEIPCFGNYDFMFFLRGNLTQEEWIEKTRKIRKYPRHLKYTLFYQNQEKLKEVHKAEFPRVFFIYDDIKQKGIRLYNRKKYREALEHLTYAYGLLRWIEFKDKKRQAEFVIKPSLEGILDDDIEEKRCYMDAPDVEEESYKACVVYILETMAYCHIELRQYTNAIECLDECEETCGDLVPDVFFRRAQARMLNKFSTEEDLAKAKEDLEKAIKLGEKYNEEIKKKYGTGINYYRKPIELELYFETKKKLEKIFEARLDLKAYNLRRLLGKVHGNKNQNEEELTEDEAIFFESCLLNTEQEDLERKYKVLKEMKSKYNLAVKFFTETKNQEQLDLTYKEYEAFHETFEQFKFFYKFKLESIDPKALNQLPEDEQKMLQDPNNQKSIEHQRANICDYIFGNGKFNLELYRYALDKVFEEYRLKMEEERKKEEALRPKVSWGEYLTKISKGNFGIYLSICFILFTIGAIGFQFYSSGSAGVM